MTDPPSPRSISVLIPGKPQPKERPRFNRRTGTAFTPAATREYEQMVKALATVATKKAGWQFDKDERYRVTMRIYWADKRLHDLSNAAKSCEDGCNGVLWHDDSQINELQLYGELDRENPRVEMTVEKL